MRVIVCSVRQRVRGIACLIRWFSVASVYMGIALLLAGCMDTATPTSLPIADTPTPDAEAAPPTQATDRILPTPTHTPRPVVLTPLVTPGLQAAPITCIGKPRPRLIVGEYGRVSDDDPIPLNIRRDPNTDDRPVARLAVLETFFVLEGPECGTDYAWYRIRRADGLEGWIAEGDGGVYYVEPFLPG